MAAKFVPRDVFPFPNSVPKTYFLGHHQAGANKIKTILPLISLVLECRDFRLPLSTHNPHLEQTVAGRDRLVVYTKCELGSADARHATQKLRRLHGQDRTFFWDKSRRRDTERLVDLLKRRAEEHDSLTGLRALVVGMPNVGKSTLLNALRSAGVASGAMTLKNGGHGRKKAAKAAQTGDQAGVTRKVGTAVRIVDPEEKGGVGGGVYVMDTPGIFQPYVEDGETMIKVALAHGIKKGLIADEILADYLLYRMNLRDPALYEGYCGPTNDVDEFLGAVARKEGRLKPGGLPNMKEAAARLLSQWREGKLGRFVLDDLTDDDVRAHQLMLAEPHLSVHQARKLQKEQKKST